MSDISSNRKRNFRRLIVKTNAGSLTPERTDFLKQKINDPEYLLFSIDRLAENLSKVLAEGYSTYPEAND
ncbi:MAG: hypothetical protein ACRCTQ_03125 [Brevinemataceae bacterium]